MSIVLVAFHPMVSFDLFNANIAVVWTFHMAPRLTIVSVMLFTKLAWRWFLGSVCSSVDFDKLGVDKLVMAKATIVRKLVHFFVLIYQNCIVTDVVVILKPFLLDSLGGVQVCGALAFHGGQPFLLGLVVPELRDVLHLGQVVAVQS